MDTADLGKIGDEHAEDTKEAAEKLDLFSFVEDTKEEKALVRKIDSWLLPTCWILLLFNYVMKPSLNILNITRTNKGKQMDRSNVGNARIAGMDKALSLSSNDYYLVIIVFQVAYVGGGPISRSVLAPIFHFCL
jgi:hypothetical protein